ncbi:protein phtf-like isoform X3 [Artemia franciscana]|uniref:protein phtf-like isoform X3 n=1 Tax=Artemia franciscana TaxID=6661 RepID=UPI0032D9F1FD
MLCNIFKDAYVSWSSTSFPKLKPKHGFFTICRQSFFKLFLLPLYRNWWSRHTHPKAFWFLVAIYIIQMGSMASYFLTAGGTIDDTQKLYFEGISPVEICVPLLMMLILTFILCQIVAGHSASPRLRKKLRGKKPKRQKRTLSENRRTLLTASGSKSSLDTSNNEGCNEEVVGTSKSQSFSQREKIRSFSEERVRTKRIPKKCQRSVSLNLDPGVLGRARRAFYGHSFLRWLRFRDAPNRPNEDEGFDSLNGNCSSSCDDGDVDVPRVVQDETVHKKRKACADKVEKLLRWKSDEGVKEGVKIIEDVEVVCGEAGPLFEDKDDGLIASEDIARVNTDGIPAINRLRNHSLPIRSQERQSNRRPRSVLTIPTARLAAESSYNSSCESDVEQTPAESPVFKTQPGTTSVDWTGVTTNSEECSYSSESETDVENHSGLIDTFPDESGMDFYGVSSLLHPSCCSSDKVSCTIWEEGDAKKVDLSALDISAAIIAKVDALPDSTDYLNGGVIAASLVAVLPLLYRLNGEPFTQLGSHVQLLCSFNLSAISQIVVLVCDVFDVILGKTFLEKFVVISAALQRFVMGSGFLFLMAIAERTFKQRFLYAKLFSHLTSSRRARRSDVPHFRLNKVRNIKTWLSVRSFIKKRGPQHSIDCIVSASFMITLFLVSVLCMELVKESQSIHQSLYNIEILCWCLVLGVFLLRFMTLGSKINRKYRSLSVLITEQINLYLQMEQKPSKKEELLLSNNVLKLAADLLKELESPFKISGVSANPILYNLTKLVVLSAISGVLSEILGFKLKLHKLKLS